MDIITSKLFEEQLKELLEFIAKDNLEVAKNFKTYLDTIIINIASKEKKYKRSIYFNNEDIKDIQFQGCVIPFLVDKGNNRYLILGITWKK